LKKAEVKSNNRLFPQSLFFDIISPKGGDIMNINKVASQIALLRKTKGLTQSELGDRVGVSFQAVSKWERGETLPDTGVLPLLARVLETSIDNILLGGERQVEYRGRITVSDMKQGLECLKKAGEYLGRDNLIYRSAINGINTEMNTDIEPAFSDDYVFEAFLAEAVIGNILSGMYVDVSDVKNNFRYEHFRNAVLEYCERFSIK